MRSRSFGGSGHAWRPASRRRNPKCAGRAGAGVVSRDHRPRSEQPHHLGPRRFGIDGLKVPRLAAWAAKGQDLERLVAAAARNGVKLGAVSSGSRKRPDGILLSWRFTSPATVLGDGIVPFFIDWGKTPHPAQTAAAGATLVGLRAEHPDAQRVGEMLRKLGLDLRVTEAPAPALIAAVDCPNGRVELR